MSRYDKYSDNALDILVKTQDIALRSRRIETGHQDLAEALILFDLPDIIAIAKRNNATVDVDKLKALNDRIESSQPIDFIGPIRISHEFRTILDKAEIIAGEELVNPSHIISAAWPAIKNELAAFLKFESKPILELWPQDLATQEDSVFFKAPQGDEILKRFGEELTAADKSFNVFGREEEINKLITIMTKYWKPNPLLIGESGVGKTALVHGLAMRIKEGRVPDKLKKARIFEIRVSDILAGTSMHGAMEDNINQIIEASRNLQDVYLFIDEFHQVVPSFANNPISESLKPALSSFNIRCIGATTDSDFSRYLEKESALLRRFQTMLVKEPEANTLLQIMDGMTPKLEQHYDISIDPKLSRRAIEIARRYLPMKRFPDKALDIIDRAGSQALLAGEKELTEAGLLGAVKDIANVIAEPGLDEKSGLADLEAVISKDILSQDEAIKAVAQAVRVAKMRIDPHKHRPAGAFLLSGPTGVGKTAFAISLAKALSGREDALFRIDMSEFSDPHTAARLLGAPPGYIGYDDTPLLSRAVDSCAGGVLLLDEFEKADPKVHRIFLQILDAGRASDSGGRNLSFSALTIIATCNVGSNSSALGFLADSEKTKLEANSKLPMTALRRVFPVELLNRFDAIVNFKALDRSDARSILKETIIRDINTNLLTEYGLTLDINEYAIDLILDKGYSPDFGVRDLHRAFRQLVSVPLSELINKVRDKKVITVKVVDNKIKLEA